MLESLLVIRRNILKRRAKVKGKPADRRTIVVYDPDIFRGLEEIARREGTNISSIFNNLYEDFLFKLDSPQTTIDGFEAERQPPAISAGPEIWRAYLKSLSRAEYKEFDHHLNTVVHLANMRFREL